MTDDEDLEEATPYVRYWVDCPYCGGVTDLTDVEPNKGERIECDECRQAFRAA